MVNASKLTIGITIKNALHLTWGGGGEKNALIFTVKIVNASKLTIGITIKNALHLT